jgi:hypothetical protein
MVPAAAIAALRFEFLRRGTYLEKGNHCRMRKHHARVRQKRRTRYNALENSTNRKKLKGISMTEEFCGHRIGCKSGAADNVHDAHSQFWCSHGLNGCCWLQSNDMALQVNSL